MLHGEVIFKTIGGVVMGTMATLIIAGTSKLQNLETKVAVIESVAFTAKDANNLQAAINTLTIQVGAIPKDNPPKWFVDQFNEMKSQIAYLYDEMRKRDLSDRSTVRQ